jgi:alginate O-acetyltransferase complex protein AlgI
MLFNSLEFLIFFPIVTLIYFLLPHKFRWFHLLVASCIFYMFFIPVYILILIFTIIVDYYAGIMIEHVPKHRKKMFLILSLIANIGVLAVFKYFNFFAENINYVSNEKWIPYLNIILPIGLSFHTFQAMSYTIEVYRGNQKAERHFGIYALYVMFYPQLVAGPIERPQNLLPQFRVEHKFSQEGFFDGFRLMLWGFFKKVVIADRLSMYVDAVFDNPGDYTNYLNCALGTFFFAIQIYCDFSGYSDIAIGAARTMGFKLMTNFDRPYFSTNIREFWSRWHISLSSWFRDYVYISLGGNRVSKKRIYINTAIVFLLSGLWHGANWTFIIWGAMHTVYIMIHMLKRDFIKRNDPFNTPVGTIFSYIITFSAVCLAWIFFRANSVHDAVEIMMNIITFNISQPFQLTVEEGGGMFSLSSLTLSFILILFMFMIEKFFSADMTTIKRKPAWDMAFCTLILTVIISFGVFQKNSFIYFQF